MIKGCANPIEGCQRISGVVYRKLLTNIRSHTIGFLYYLMAVLVAIAIPIFTTQLEKSRETTDMANLRSAYAAAVTYAMSENAADKKMSYNPNTDGSLDDSETPTFKCGQGTATNGNADVSAFATGVMKYTNATPAKGKGIKITFESGAVKEVAFES